jgi:hypothetical protein
MIAESSRLIHDLAAHAEQTAISEGASCVPSTANHQMYLPLIEKYIALEQTLQQFFAG